MKFFNRFINYTVIITTCVLFVCSFWTTLSAWEEGKVLSESMIPLLSLWEPFPVGIVTGLLSALFFSNDEMSKKEFWGKTITHYILINVVTLLFGYFYGWYDLNVGQVFRMLISTLVIYVIVYTAIYIRDQHTVDKINERLSGME